MNSSELFKDFCRNSIKAADVDPALGYLNYMVDRMEMNDDQILWLCFLWGLTYQLPTAYIIWNEFPDLELVDEQRITEFYNLNRDRLPFQQDKQKNKKDMVKTILSYQAVVGKSQRQYFDTLLDSEDPQENFDRMWTPLKSIFAFGRFSTWNQCQALKHVAGYNVEPTRLMLGESDAVSFTDGLAYAFGQEDKLTQKIVENGKKRKIFHHWTEAEKAEMEEACKVLKEELGLDNFQLETLACAYKKIWRERESRYVGYYNDRLADDIKKCESLNWYGVDWELLWDARKACIPEKYLHGDRGVDKNMFTKPPEAKVYC